MRGAEQPVSVTLLLLSTTPPTELMQGVLRVALPSTSTASLAIEFDMTSQPSRQRHREDDRRSAFRLAQLAPRSAHQSAQASGANYTHLSLQTQPSVKASEHSLRGC
jgi:hypothetical protein